jgi:hypothetical protein
MANVDAPFGLRPVADVSGRPWNGAVRAYSTAAGDGTAIYLGDPVILSGTSQTINGRVYLDVDQAATGDKIIGVVVGVDPAIGAGANGRESTIYRAASTVRILYVCDDPNALFEIQEVSGGTALTANDAGLNADFVVAAGSATTGMSGVELNNATEATTNTLDLKIVGLVAREDNEIGEHAKWLVRINRHFFANQVAGV